MAVRPDAKETADEEGRAERDGHDSAPHGSLRGTRWVVAVALVVAACFAATGLLYLLKKLGLLGFGPSVGGALPLEQLARHDAQPLARVVVAWLPAGLLAGAALHWAGARAAPLRAAVSFAVALPLLVLAGAASDAAAVSAGVGSHISTQFGRAGTWVAVATLVIGALARGASAPRVRDR